MTSSTDTPLAGASINLLSGTSAAGWASQVGYQNDRISRRAWYREPAPPSNPSNEGGLRNNVFTNFHLLCSCNLTIVLE